MKNRLLARIRNEFTLVEIFIIIVIVSIVVLVMLPNNNKSVIEHEQCHKELSVAHTPQDSITLFKLHPVCLNYIDTLIHK